jgi:hypothetical protein
MEATLDISSLLYLLADFLIHSTAASTALKFISSISWDWAAQRTSSLPDYCWATALQ